MFIAAQMGMTFAQFGPKGYQVHDDLLNQLKLESR